MSYDYGKTTYTVEHLQDVEYRGHTITVTRQVSTFMKGTDNEESRTSVNAYRDLPEPVPTGEFEKAPSFGRGRGLAWDRYTGDLDNVIRKAKHVIDEIILDDEQRMTVRLLAGACPTGLRTLDDAPNAKRARPATLVEPQIGDVAWVHGTGRYRRGYVYKLGKSRVGVAYYVPSSARIYRRSEKPGDVYLTGEKV